MAFAPFDVDALIEKINLNSVNLKDIENEGVRRKCLAAARSLCYALETPLDSVTRLNYAEPTHQAAIRIGLELKLFMHLNSGEGPKSTSELAKATGAETELLARLVRHLAAMGTIYEVDTDRFLPTALSKALAESVHSDGITVCQDIIGPSLSKFHQRLETDQYCNPSNPVDTAFQFAFETKAHLFEWLENHPNKMMQFNNHMASTQSGIPTSLVDPDFYPFDERLVTGADRADDAVFMVDVGGNKGHDLQEIYRRHPDLPGVLVLQDQQHVIQDATSLDSSIRPMGHDFFTQQPIKAARVYHLHRILHDWPDSPAHTILTHLHAAMKPGYSKLLVNEIVIPAKGAHMTSTGLDIVMMSMFAGAQRTEEGWRRLLESAGFHVVGIWKGERGGESLLECEVA